MTESHECSNVAVEVETEKALLVIFEDGTEKWVPKSVILEGSEVTEEGDEGTLRVKRWFAEKEELP